MLKKITTLIITLLLVSVVTFVAFSVIPGDPALAKLGTYATPERVEALREEMGMFIHSLFFKYNTFFEIMQMNKKCLTKLFKSVYYKNINYAIA